MAGFDSQREVITAVQPCKDKATGSVCDIVLVLDQWLSPQLADNAEVRRYFQAYATKLGMDGAGEQDAAQRAKALFSQYKGLWSEVASKMQGAKGYPVKTGFTLAMGGAQCKDSKTQQTQSGDDSGSADKPTKPAGLAGALAGGLGGLLHKKQDDAGSTATAAPASAISLVPLPPGEVALITVASQLVSISNGSVDADRFVVPANFKKVELKAQ